MRKTHSIKRLIAYKVIPGSVAIFLLISFVTERSVLGVFSGEIQSSVDTSARHAAETTDSKLDQIVQACRSVAQNHVVINGIVDLEHRNSALQSFFRSLIMPGPFNQHIAMTDYRGKAIAENQKRLPTRPALWIPTVMRGDSYLGIVDSCIVFAEPIRYAGQPEGAIVATYPLDDFFEELALSSDAGVKGFAMNGAVLASSNYNVLRSNGPIQIPDNWLAAKAPVAKLPDVSAIVLKSKETAFIASKSVRIAMFIQFGAVSLAMAIAIWIASTLITKPLTSLFHRMHEIQNTGDLTLRVQEEGPSEFVKLGNRFNSMLAELERTTVSRENFRKLALVAKYTDNGVVITDAIGRVEWINEGFSRITGYSLEEVRGKKPGEFLQGEKTDPTVVQKMSDAIKEKRAFEVEVDNYKKNGEHFHIAIEAQPIKDELGEVVRFMAIERDITERKQAEAEHARLSGELQEAAHQAGMAEIANGILHNVGNVLNSINVSTNLLLDKLGNSQINKLRRANEVIQNADDLAHFLAVDERGKHFPSFLDQVTTVLEHELEEQLSELRSLAANVDHVKETISFQQSFARTGGLTERIDLNALMDNVLSMNLDGLANHHIEIVRDFSDVPNLFLNKHKLLQICINLISNAKQALRDVERERVITVSIDGDDQNIQIRVMDNGIGISKQNLQKIFRHGFTTKSDGHGFGLHSCAVAAQEMGGSISVSSDGEGLGATFVLQLPINAAQAEPV